MNIKICFLFLNLWAFLVWLRFILPSMFFFTNCYYSQKVDVVHL